MIHTVNFDRYWHRSSLMTSPCNGLWDTGQNVTYTTLYLGLNYKIASKYTHWLRQWFNLSPICFGYFRQVLHSTENSDIESSFLINHYCQLVAKIPFAEQYCFNRNLRNVVTYPCTICGYCHAEKLQSIAVVGCILSFYKLLLGLHARVAFSPEWWWQLTNRMINEFRACWTESFSIRNNEINCSISVRKFESLSTIAESIMLQSI